MGATCNVDYWQNYIYYRISSYATYVGVCVRVPAYNWCTRNRFFSFSGGNETVVLMGGASLRNTSMVLHACFDLVLTADLSDSLILSVYHSGQIEAKGPVLDTEVTLNCCMSIQTNRREPIQR